MLEFTHPIIYYVKFDLDLAPATFYPLSALFSCPGQPLPFFNHVHGGVQKGPFLIRNGQTWKTCQYPKVVQMVRNDECNMFLFLGAFGTIFGP